MSVHRLTDHRSAAPIPRSGFTLLELGIVVAIVALLALLAVPRIGGVLRGAKISAAEADMEAIRTAFIGDGAGFGGLVGDLEGIAGFSPAYLRPANLIVPTNLVGVADHWLDDDGRRGHRAYFAADCGKYNLAFPDAYSDFSVFTNRDEVAGRGWGGPYLARARIGEFPGPNDRRADHPNDRTAQERGFFRLVTPEHPYGLPGEPAFLDPWDNPYILQVPPANAFDAPGETTEPRRFRYARIVSAGPDGVLDTPCYPTSTTQEARRDGRLAGRRETADETAKVRGDDIVLFLLRADTYEDEDL